MIISNLVNIKLGGINSKYYENLGYIIPRYVDDQGRYYVKKDTFIEVKVFDLPKGSNIKVVCRCDNCGKEKLIPFYKAIKYKIYLCKSCTFKGRSVPENVKLKMSNNAFFKGVFGKNHPAFNEKLQENERLIQHAISGISTWKRKVKKRDRYTCKKCGYIGNQNDGILEAHHINNFRDFKNERIDIDNGITLCKNCHKLIHSKYGKNISFEEFNNFLKGN